MSQQDLQNSLWQQRGNLQIKSELCNVLYERELIRLASEHDLTLESLQKNIKSLPYYVSRAAENICQTYSPLDLDSSNASWLSRQSPSPFSIKADQERTAHFYREKSKVALIVPISICVFGIEYIALDSIDEIDQNDHKIHCNQHGWFRMNGEPFHENVEKKSVSHQEAKVLLRPGKPIMSAACCGHQWKNLHKTSARALSLRELLLATRINWHNFAKLVAPTR